MSDFVVVSLCNGQQKGLFSTKDFYEAQLILHQVAVEYAREQHARLVEEAATSQKKTDFIKTYGKNLFYVEDNMDAEKQIYQKLVYKVDVVPNGILWESYYCDTPKVDTVFQLILVEEWPCEYFSFTEWVNNHSITLFTNGSEDERRKSIIACLTKSSVILDWPEKVTSTPTDLDCDKQDEEKPEPDEEECQPLYIVLSEHSDEWKGVASHVEPYSDEAIRKILEEQQTFCDNGEDLDVVVLVIEAATSNMLTNNMVIELFDRCRGLNMSVLVSVPLESHTRLRRSVLKMIDFIFNIHPNTEKAFNTTGQTYGLFVEGSVYDRDREFYNIEKVAWLEYDD